MHSHCKEKSLLVDKTLLYCCFYNAVGSVGIDILVLSFFAPRSVRSLPVVKVLSVANSLPGTFAPILFIVLFFEAICHKNLHRPFKTTFIEAVAHDHEYMNTVKDKVWSTVGTKLPGSESYREQIGLGVKRL